MMLSRSRQERSTPRLRPVGSEPDAAEWRLRCLLASAIVNHRRTDDGLDAAAVLDVVEALAGGHGVGV